MAQLIPAAQYGALVESAGCAVIERSQVMLTGQDRASLLHKFCTQDVLSRKAGEGAEAFLLNVQGKILAYVYFFVGEDAIVLDTAASQAAAIIQHLDRYVIREDVKFSDLSAERFDIVVAGPNAAATIEKVAGVAPPGQMLGLALGKVGDVDVSVSRVPILGTDSYFISTAADASVVIEKLQGAGATRCDADAVKTRRIECGSPLYGTDITLDNLPQEVNRDALVIHFKKGCYLGQETVARIDALGHVNKLLVQLKFASDAVLVAPGSELVVDGKAIGRITSSTWSPRWNAPLALAYVRREYARMGAELATSVGACEVVGPAKL